MRRVRARIAEYHVDRSSATCAASKYSSAMRNSVGPTRVGVGDARRCTSRRRSSRPARALGLPTFPGARAIGYRTSETDLRDAGIAAAAGVIGGGPLGCELAQAFCRLGSHVTIIQNEPKFLPREERDAAELLSRSMARDGVDIMLNTTVVGARVENGDEIRRWRQLRQVKSAIPADEILLSIGRVPNVERIWASNAGIALRPDRGIKVDDFLRTTNAEYLCRRRCLHVA